MLKQLPKIGFAPIRVDPLPPIAAVQEMHARVRTPRCVRSQACDNAGNRNARNDAMGNSEHFEYDSLRRVSNMVDAEGGETHFRYNYLGNVTYVSDPEGRVTQY